MKIWRNTFLFSLGGGLYTVIELLYRGRSHGSMFLLGGACFLVLGKLRRLRLSWPLLTLLGAAAITAGELFTGLAINRDHSVWDYRGLPYNYLGQICLKYSLLWIPVSLGGMLLHRAADRALPR